jgi:alanyl-tRNA synthetase
VRRLEAVTGREAIRMMLSDKKSTREISNLVGRPLDELVSGVEQLKENVSSLQKELKKVKSQAFTTGKNKIGEESQIDGISFVTHYFGDTDRDIMSGWIDKHKEDSGAVVALGLGNVNGKLTFMASASATASKKFQINIGEISKELLPRFGGKGGGKANFAQGSVEKETDTKNFFAVAGELIAKQKGNK